MEKKLIIIFNFCVFVCCAQYCIPTPSTGVTITRVKIGSLDNSSTYTAGGYADYSSTHTALVDTGNNLIQITATGSSNIDKLVYIDWGNNFSFNTSYGNNENFYHPSNIYISPSILDGSYRMRVVIANHDNNHGAHVPCISGQAGEAEDYTLVLDRTSSGVSSVEKLALKAVLHPNPVYEDGIITLETNEKIQYAQVHIYNAIGDEVKRITEINTTAIPINTSDLGQGIYFYTLSIDGQIISGEKFIVQ